jgi:hypothetical protein
MMQQCPPCSPEFGEEWSKRMLARLKVDDFLEVFEQAYEKSFTDDEILEMIKLQEKSERFAAASSVSTLERESRRCHADSTERDHGRLYKNRS